MQTIILLILTVFFIVFFIKWIRLKKFFKSLHPYYELLYHYDNNHKLTFAVISPVMAVRPRSEYSAFTSRVYYTDYADAEAERQRVIEQNKSYLDNQTKKSIL